MNDRPRQNPAYRLTHPLRPLSGGRLLKALFPPPAAAQHINTNLDYINLLIDY